MSEFSYLFHSTKSAAGSPEETQRHLQKWMTWFQELSDNGHLKNRGNQLERARGKMVVGKQKTVTDGPFAESKDVVVGYVVVEAADLNEAASIARGCPILDVEGAVEVRPVVRM